MPQPDAKPAVVLAAPKHPPREHLPQSIMQQLRSSGWLERPTLERQQWLDAIGKTLHALGWRGNAARLSDVLPRQGLLESGDEFLNALALLGYSSREIRLHAMPDRFPVVLLMPMPVVVTKPDEYPHDTKLITKAFSFEKTQHIADTSEEFARQQTGKSWMQVTFQRFSKLFMHIVAVSLIIGLLTVSVPLFVMTVYDLVINSHSLPSLGKATDLLMKLLLGVSLVIVLECALRFMVIRSLSWFGSRMQVLVGTALLDRFLSLAPAVTERAAAADQLSRIRAFDTMRDFISGPQMLSMLELPWCAVLLVVIGLIGGPVVLVPMGGMLLYAALAYAVRKPLHYEMFRAARSGSERQQAAMDMITRLPAMSYSGVAGTLSNRYQSSVRRAMHTTFRINLMVAVLEHSAHAITALVGLLTLVVGLYSIWGGTLTVGALVAMMILTWRLLGIIQSNCIIQPRLHYLRGSVQQINRLMSLQVEAAEHQKEISVEGLRGNIECNGIMLRNNRSGDFILRSLSLDVQPGQLVAIMGQSGAGKSSLLKVLCGLYPTQAGSLRLDGLNLKQYVPQDLRQHIAYMPQSPDFFSGTIADNLRLVAPASDDAALRDAIEKAGAADEIAAMPQGLATEIGTGKNHLPLSLAHRLNIARIYLQESNLLLIDEMPYDILNSQTGAAYLDLLKHFKCLKTVIYVTHRVDFAEIADQAVWLRHDMAPLTGTPKQVLTAMQKV